MNQDGGSSGLSRNGWQLPAIIMVLLAVVLAAFLSGCGCEDQQQAPTETTPTVIQPSTTGINPFEEGVIVPEGTPPAEEGDAAAGSMPTVISMKEIVGPCIGGQQEIRHVTEYSDGTSASSISLQPCEE